MNSGSSNSPRQFGSRRWPVLARLADVSSDAPAPASTTAPLPAQEQSRRLAAGFVEYRVDSPDVASSQERVPPPHKPRSQSVPSLPRRKSPILPDSDPFALPAPTLEERFAPLARFVVVFALVTAIGTSILNKYRQSAPAGDTMQSPVSTHSEPPIRARLTADPGPAGEQSLKAAMQSDITSTAPTASGPAGNFGGSSIGNTEVRTALEPSKAGSAFGEDPTPLEAPALNLSTPERLPEIAPAVPVGPQLLKTDTPALPQVQTSNAPAAIETAVVAPVAGDRPTVARLPGYLLPAPTRQAQHDENQQSLY